MSAPFHFGSVPAMGQFLDARWVRPVSCCSGTEVHGIRPMRLRLIALGARFWLDCGRLWGNPWMLPGWSAAGRQVRASTLADGSQASMAPCTLKSSTAACRPELEP